MRRLAITLLLLGCDPGDPPRDARVAAVEQATTEDGVADGVFGQPTLTVGTEPVVVSSTSTHFPIALGTNTVPVTTDSNPLVLIADRGAHRVLGLYSLETFARILAGQFSYDGKLPNGGGAISGSTLNAPSAVAFAYEQIAIADTGNHRVLMGYRSHAVPWPPSVVFGQHGRFDSNARNDGGLSADSLAEPGGLAFDASFSPGRLLVADTGNHRILFFNLASTTITTATTCSGQDDCSKGEPNRGGAVSRLSLNEPRGLATVNSTTDPLRGYYVADTGNHRVLHFPVFSSTPDTVYGQGGDFTTAVPSKGGVSATSLKSPTAVAFDPLDGSLYVADTGHHRVLHFPRGSTVADRAYGQADLTSGDPPALVSASRMRSPSGVALTPSELFVADTGFSRVLRFKKPCDEAKCNDGNPCTDDSCAPTGGCRNLTQTYSKVCAPYRCDPVGKTCLPCDATRPCKAPYSCVDGTCAVRCSNDAGCASLGRTCVDGYCCDKTCDGPCERCDRPKSEGTCVPVEGPPIAPRTCGGPTGECGALCNGVDGKACYIAPRGTPCGTESCASDTVNRRGACDGVGSCSATTVECAPYGCSVNACRTSCRFDYECASGARCAGGACVFGLAAGGGCGFDRRASALAALVLAGAFAVSIARRRR